MLLYEHNFTDLKNKQLTDPTFEKKGYFLLLTPVIYFNITSYITYAVVVMIVYLRILESTSLAHKVTGSFSRSPRIFLQS